MTYFEVNYYQQTNVMKQLLLFISFLCSVSLFSQTNSLISYEVTLIGPKNTDLHHPAQVDYYVDYFLFLEEEVDAWLGEINRDLRGIRKRNKNRIIKKKPIKTRDYPAWKKNNEILKDLETDKAIIQKYIAYWENFDFSKPDSAVHVFMENFDENLCYDLISEQIVLAPREYKIKLFEPEPNLFVWYEFIKKDAFTCPSDYENKGKTCAKRMELAIEKETPPVFLIQNQLTDLPFHLDGYKQITCR